MRLAARMCHGLDVRGMVQVLWFRGPDVMVQMLEAPLPSPPRSLIRGNLFFFSLTSTKFTTQFILTSNVKTFV